MLSTHAKAGMRGNILFVIFMGLALFAVLSAAVMENSGSQDIRKEQAAVQAQTIMRYAEEIRKAATYLLVNEGVSEADIRFAHPKLASDYGDITVNPGNQLFADNGGGISYMTPPEIALKTTTNAWEFFGTSAIPLVGTSEADLVLVLPDIKERICRNINQTLGYDYNDPIPDDTGDSKCVYSSTAADRFAGTFKTGSDINQMGTTNFKANVPANEACVTCSGGSTYYYYKVLLAR